MVHGHAPIDDAPATRPTTSRGELLAAGLLGAAALATVRIVDPYTPGTYPVCPSIQLFGVLCPLCGGLRSTHALLSGEVLESIRMNVLVPLGALLLLLLLARRLLAPDASLPRPPRAVVVSALVLVAVFGVVRNVVALPFGPVP